jgi:hypothetical protein
VSGPPPLGIRSPQALRCPTGQCCSLSVMAVWWSSVRARALTQRRAWVSPVRRVWRGRCRRVRAECGLHGGRACVGRKRQARLWSSRSHAELCESASSPMRAPALKAILELVSALEALPR